jgi:hypothetical protein
LTSDINPRIAFCSCLPCPSSYPYSRGQKLFHYRDLNPAFCQIRSKDKAPRSFNKQRRSKSLEHRVLRRIRQAHRRQPQGLRQDLRHGAKVKIGKTLKRQDPMSPSKNSIERRAGSAEFKARNRQRRKNPMSRASGNGALLMSHVGPWSLNLLRIRRGYGPRTVSTG